MFKGQVVQGRRGCPETSAKHYDSELHNIPEEGRSHLHHVGSRASEYSQNYEKKNWLLSTRELSDVVSPDVTTINTLRTGLFKLFKRPFPGFLTILTL